MEESWSEDIVSKQGFLGELIGLIRVVSEVDTDGCSHEVLETMVGLWLLDIMNGESLDAFHWWEELESWGAKKERQKAARQFMHGLLDIFESKLKGLGKPFLKAMLAQFKTNPDLRFKEFDGYFHFIQDVQHTIWANLPVTCVIGGHASGDMFGIGASALLKLDMNVLVHFKDDAPEQDHSEGMYNFFSELLGSERVRLAGSGKGCFDRQAQRNSVYELMRDQRSFCWLAPYNMGTYFLSDQFQQHGGLSGSTTDNRDTIRRGFHVERLSKRDAITEFLNARIGSLDTLKQRRVLVLWSRFTGKKGEYHPEHDTSFMGIAQLAWLAAELGYTVIIAGDKPILHGGIKDSFTRKHQYGTICRNLESYYGEPRCFDLTEFWTEPDWKRLSGGKRVTQFQVYELLHRECDIRHLGMRSGNLEALALLGYFVRYMEELKSYGGERMKVWHDTDIGYERILLFEPPTRVGKYIHHDRKPVSSHAFIPPFITARNRGFPNTSSRGELKPKDELEQYEQEELRKYGEMHPRDSRRSTFLEDLKSELAKKKLELEEKSTKPLDVTKYESGFTPEDLLQISEYLCLLNPRAEHPLEETPTPNEQEGRTGKLTFRQYKILMAIQKLLRRK
ncbi:hypothetical protein P2318_28685 [Myxococcaceae bacterium GXIMD 01537]